MFSKVLIANRGEIALRVIRGAQSMGYQTVAVYTDADMQSPHVLQADEAINIGKGPVGDSYLHIEKIIKAAKRSGAGAIHPGYGFLSENPDFAKACDEAGLTFIGPSAAAITLMGSKRLAKLAMLKADVPCIPGYEGDDQNDSAMQTHADAIGYPVMIKASAGGGGRGMRVVHSKEELSEGLRAARAEAKGAFGNDELILEKAVIEPRHIEIQVVADSHGNVVHLGERDCSVQRRHQKVVEECPSPVLDESLRDKMGKAAVKAAKVCDYCGVGTVEFLLDENGQFYFLEMNTRLQVEHPVTELVTGVDLVEWQLRIASGEQLPWQQSDITLTGHAIEVRLYAEDPNNQFMPQTGEVLRWQYPESDGVRVDAGISEGQTISPFYDPMLGKLIAFGETRDIARRRLIRQLADTQLLGLNSNLGFLGNILKHSRFADGSATTGFLEQFPEVMETSKSAQQQFTELALACCLIHLHNSRHDSRNNWQSAGRITRGYQLSTGTQKHQLTLSIAEKDVFHISDGTDTVAIKLHQADGQKCIFSIDNHMQKTDYFYSQHNLYISSDGGQRHITDVTYQAQGGADTDTGDEVLSPMDGVVTQVKVSPGESVSKGQILVLLDAMKMEHQLKAPRDGVVESVPATEGQQAKSRQLLITLKKDKKEQGS